MSLRSETLSGDHLEGMWADQGMDDIGIESMEGTVRECIRMPHHRLLILAQR
jgi:hypothetical protein